MWCWEPFELVRFEEFTPSQLFDDFIINSTYFVLVNFFFDINQFQ